MNLSPFSFLLRGKDALCQAVKKCLRLWMKPANHDLVLNAAMDLTRRKPELILENLLLRQQLIVLKRQVRHPALTWRARSLFALLSSRLPAWKEALVIVQTDTVLRWHRDMFRWAWRRRSKSTGRRGRPPLTDEIVALIVQIAKEHQTWGAERIRGEMLRLGVSVARSTIQEYIQEARRPRSPNQAWATFLRNHAKGIWACDFLQTYDLPSERCSCSSSSS